MVNEKISPRNIRFLNAAIAGCLLLMAFAAPLSIAATQASWAFGLLFWMIRSVVSRDTGWRPQAIDLAIFAFTGLTILSSFFSYERAESLHKLVAVSLLTIVYLVSQNIRKVATARRMVALMLIAGMVTVVWTLGLLATGKNLKIIHLTADSPLRTATPHPISEGDTLLSVNGTSVASPEAVSAALAKSSGDKITLQVYHFEWVFDTTVPAEPVASGDLGITEWSRGRDTRAQGFFGHYTTYSEVLQLLLSIAIGLMLSSPGGWLDRWRLLFGVTACLYAVALFLTVTRASWGGAIVSAGVMTLIAARKKTLLLIVPLAVILGAAGVYYLSQKRNVGVIDTSDASTTWRTTVWREAVGVLTASPRHMLVGVGMESIKTHWPDWHMFDNGNLPLGHLHSDYLEIAFERGIPTLIAWLAWMAIYLSMLWRGLRKGDLSWPEKGLLLGALGGTIGFLTAGTVHYNWGDSEVAELFFMLMGLSLAVLRNIPSPETAAA